MSASVPVAGSALDSGLLHLLSKVCHALPTPRPMKDVLDGNIGVHLILGTILLLVPDPTPRVRLVRAAAAPLISGAWLYLGYVPMFRTPLERWGSAMLFTYFVFRTFELLVFFEPEKNVYRLRPAVRRRKRGKKAAKGHANGKAEGDSSHGPNGAAHADKVDEHPFLVPEPVPQGWTWSKLVWATSLWWSWRGIGWNYGPPLATSMKQRPYTRTSSRVHFLLWRGLYLAAIYVADDLAATFMRLVAPDFFITCTTPYAALSTAQRAAYSIATVTRILCVLEYSAVGWALSCVTIGGLAGIDNEMFSPWGWPPLVGSLHTIWAHPGLGHMWSRALLTDQAWNQYYRRCLHCYGWVLLGERVLGLPPSGAAVNNRHAQPSPALVSESGTESANDITFPIPPIAPRAVTATSAASTPASSAPQSGRASPAHPLQGQTRRRAPDVVSNLIKSAIVFTLSGLHHDYSSVVMLLDKVRGGELHAVSVRNIFSLTPFFVVQPAALVVEALVKRRWRAYKHAKGTPHQPATTLERAVGFAWTWVWLGWSAGWFVEGMARLGVWGAFPGYKHFTVLGPVWDYFRSV